MVGGGGSHPNRLINAAVKSVTAADYSTLKEWVDREEPYIFIPADADIVLPDRKGALVLHTGQTLYGDRGHNGSNGGRLFVQGDPTNNIDDFSVIQLASHARISGLRIEGPVKVSDSIKRNIGIQTAPGSINIRIDNNDLSGWPWAAISVKQSQNVWVDHNYIHENIKSGLGYGVVVQNGEATAEISCNLFNANRHAIAGSGNYGEGYWAHHNFVMPGGGKGAYHQFDMHGWGNEQIAGKYVVINHNWFYYGDYGTANRSAIMLRGVPETGAASITDNRFHSPYRITENAVTVQGVAGSIAPEEQLRASNRFNVNFTFSDENGQCLMQTGEESVPVWCAAARE